MTDDPLIHLLARLPQAQPDAERSARVRARCGGVLMRRQRSEAARPTPAFRLWPLGVALSGAYVTEVVRQALRLYGLI